MALRYIDTEFYKHPFVRKLPGAYKALYLFIITHCDNAGIWSPEFEISSIYLDQKVDRKNTEEKFRARFTELENGKWFFPDFIQWQYPNGLQKNNPAHKKVIERLFQLKLIDSDLKVIGAPKELASPLQGSKGKGKGKGTGKGTGKEEDKEMDEGRGIQEHALQKWIKENLPTVTQLKTQLTFIQAKTLTETHDKKLLKEILEAMENKADLLKKYKSVYLTITQWIKHRTYGTNKKNTGTNQLASATTIERGRDFGNL